MSDQPANPANAPTVTRVETLRKHFKFEGRNYTLYKRRPGKDEHWYFRIQRNGQVRPRSMETNVFENAEIKAKAMIRAAKSENWDEFLEKTALRKTCIVTLKDIFKHYRAYPHRKPAASTRELNIHALEELLKVKYPGQEAENLPITAIDADMVWDWKQKILASAGTADENRHRQLLRSANSRLIQARSIFTNDLQSYYSRQGKLTMPKQIDQFLKEPKFPADECGKTDYWPPGDNIIAATFKALEQLLDPTDSPHIHTQNKNLYLAIWLALGFGLRKSEITAAKLGWFQNIDGVLYCAGDELAKNKRFPRVRAQLGAWEKISPQIDPNADPETPILTGTAQECNDHVFRRCSDWLKALGWKTQKAVHEFRSYAGCQVAMGDRTGPVDLRAAQEFLRHASITTTENFYMRYLRSQLKEVHLQLPIAQPFIPKVLEA